MQTDLVAKTESIYLILLVSFIGQVIRYFSHRWPQRTFISFLILTFFFPLTWITCQFHLRIVKIFQIIFSNLFDTTNAPVLCEPCVVSGPEKFLLSVLHGHILYYALLPNYNTSDILRQWFSQHGSFPIWFRQTKRVCWIFPLFFLLTLKR